MCETMPTITPNPEIVAGKPVIAGTRISVDFVIGLLAEDWSETDILAKHPSLTHAHILACCAYARDVLRAERVYPSAT